MSDSAINLTAGGFFLICFGAAMYVVYKFLALVISLDAAIMRLSASLPAMRPVAQTVQQSPEPGSYVPYSDEEAWAAEAVGQKANKEHLTAEEIAEFLKHAVGAATDK